MIRDLIDTFRNTTAAVSQKFVRKSQIGSHTQNYDMSVMFFFRSRHVAVQFQETLKCRNWN